MPARCAMRNAVAALERFARGPRALAASGLIMIAEDSLKSGGSLPDPASYLASFPGELCGYGGSELDFGFSEEQEMLRDAAKRFLADNCSTKFVRQMMADESAHDAGFWRKLVDLGWPGLLIPEEYGGQGGTFLDMTVIAEEAGKALVPGPFFAAALLGAPIVIESFSEAQKKELLPKMAKGEI